MEKIKITNPEKIIYQKGKIKKIDIIKYYIDVCDLLLPYITKRQLTVIRCHDGINNAFIKKHQNSDNTNVNIIKKDGKEYFYLDSKIQIIEQVQNGTIEFHISSNSIDNDIFYMVFDLDPDEKMNINKLRNSTLKVKEVLDELSLKSFVKTSGGKGYHIVVPLKNVSNKNAYEFSKSIAILLERKYSDLFTTNIRKDKRKGKIFVDYLRNNVNSTCVSVYSLRAKENASISFPISWNNVKKIKPNQININNYKQYLDDSWKDFFNIIQSIK